MSEREDQTIEDGDRKELTDPLPSVEEVEQLKKQIAKIRTLIAKPDSEIEKSLQKQPKCYSGILSQS